MSVQQEAKNKIQELVERFSIASRNKDYINSQSEENIKTHYIEPLLEALGWTRWDMNKEERILKGRADYILKIGNEEFAVIEAKKVGVSLSDEEGRQAVSYAYHRKIKFAILTNFKEIKVYHALSNIKNIDKNLLKFGDNSVFRLGFEEFIDKFDKLLLISRESFEKGEINKLLSKKDEKINKPIDVHILNDLLKIRDWLSKELKSKKNYLSQEKIDEVVQILIDRLIFIRSIEDRGLEPMNYLKSLEADVRQQNVKLQLFPYLVEEFKKFNDRYDSKLFEPSILEKEGTFSDEVLRKVILALYFGVEGNQERYLFDQIPVDLFGSIYEQYLGTILEGTEKRVKLDSKSGKRKKMGIYYTPSYIVDYIVKNTVGEYIKDKTIDEILEVNIVDPACGSGSFLIRAFQEVCNVIEKKLKNGELSESYISFKDIKERLSFSQKTTILKNCIYGVDLDEKAVELAHLNLILATLDGETSSLVNRKLPKMSNNLKNGNSLIDDPKVAGDKAFNWNAQFPEPFHKGGFDVVVGNPPYVNNRGLVSKDKIFFEKNYITAYQQYDLYVIFYELSLKLLKEDGKIGFITPNKFAITNYGVQLRKLMLSYQIEKIVDVSQLNVFGDASTYPYVLIIKKSQGREMTAFYSPEGKFEVLNKKLFDLKLLDYNKPFIFSSDLNENNILDKITGEKIIEIYRAKPTSNNINEKAKAEVITNKEIDRFFINSSNKKIDNKKDWQIVLPAILMKKICFVPTASILNKVNQIPINTVYVIHSNNQNITLEYLIGVINSKLMGYYSRKKFGTTAMRGGFIELRTFEIKEIPIKLPIQSQEKTLTDLVDTMLSLQKQLHEGKPSGNEKERLEQQIKNTDYEIDQEVYKLYGLTKEEIKIVEDSLK